jgi:CheY-like chemotaxis protein
MIMSNPEGFISYYICEENDNATRKRSKASTQSSPIMNHLVKKSILIVEDEALVAENLREFVEKAGYKVVAVLSTGEEALETLNKKSVDLVLMDVRLGGTLSGVETVLLIHRTLKEIPVIFLSAYAEDLFSTVSSLSPSLYRYVSKPYKEEDLEKIIREFLG